MGVIIRQSIKGTIVTYIGAFIGFLTTMFIVTKFLEPEDIGLTRVIFEIATMFGLLAQLGTSSSAFRFFPYFKNKNNNNNGFFFYLMTIPFVGCILFIALYLILKEPVTNMFIKESPLIVSYYYWVIPLIVFTTYLTLFETYSTINMRITMPRINREIIIRILTLAVYLIYGFHFVARDGLVAGFVLVYGVAAIFLFIYISKISSISMRHDTSLISKPLRRDIFRYSIFLITVALAGTILGKLDLFMISFFMGLDSAGIYSIAFFIAAVIDMPSRSISAISSPIAADALKEGDFKTANTLYQRVSLHQALVGGFIFILIWINIDNIFSIMPNGNIYFEGKWVLFFIGMAKLVSMTLGFGGVLISFSKYYYWSLYFTVFLSGIGFLTNYLLIPVFGITGAAIATFSSNLLSFIIQQWIVLKKVKGNPYTLNLLKVFVIFLIITAVNYVLVKINNPWIDGIYRTTIIAIIGVALIYFSKVSAEVNNTMIIIIKNIRKYI
jgi:O-antigen/teichoic acid export membrane protein